MRILKNIFVVIAVLVVIALLFGWYIGFFNKVNTNEMIEGGYKVVGIEVTGPYSKVGKSLMSVNKKLNDMGIVSTKGFGIYYDDPKTVPPEKCRSFVGNILEEKDLNKISELKSAGFRIDSIPKTTTVVAEFPLKNSISYMVGAMKVYPVLSKYIEEKGYKATMTVEIYDPVNKKIIFMMQH